MLICGISSRQYGHNLVRFETLHSQGNCQEVVIANLCLSFKAPFRRELRRIMGDDSDVDFTYLQGLIETMPYPGQRLPSSFKESMIDGS